MQRGIRKSIPSNERPTPPSASCETMQGMDAEERSELERLRARAYGPDADLADDPDAWARLRELEEDDRQGRTEASESLAAAETEPPDAGVADDAEERDAGGDRTASRRPRVKNPRTLWLWAGSLAAVAAIASAASIAAVTVVPVARTAGVAQVDSLLPDPSVRTDSLSSLGIDSSQLTGYADYLGLTAFAGPTQIDSAGNRADCLVLVDTNELSGEDDDEDSFRGGFRYGGCGAGSFPATVEFIVTPELPEDFRNRFPVGTAVQFVREGERVGVFSDAE